MIYYTGDIHGNKNRIVRLCEEQNLTTDDTIVLLGDVGANYYGDERDDETKAHLSKHPVTILCVHGNHEMRPETIPTYKETEWNGGVVYREDKYPSLLFAKDGETVEDSKKRLSGNK